MTDEQILDLYFDRDESAIRETESAYGWYLLRISNNILRDMEDAGENVNDTYLKAWNTMPPHRPTALSHYLGKLCRTGAIDMYRKKHAEKRVASNYAECIDELADAIPANASDVPEEALLAEELKTFINCFVKGLDEKKRAVFLGRYYYMDSVNEIAQYTQLSTANVKTTLSRLRKELAEQLRKEGYAV